MNDEECLDQLLSGDHELKPGELWKSFERAMVNLREEDRQREEADSRFWADAEAEGLRQYRHIDQTYDDHLYEGVWREGIFWSRRFGVTIYIPSWLMEREMREVVEGGIT